MYTKQDIINQLKKMNAPQDSTVLMHTSLRCIGDVEGGANGLLDTLIEYFTEKGGLFCVPTHTWDNLYTDKITLDMQNPESNLGAFTVIAAKDNRGLRSENPTHSMVVFGDRKKAEQFIADDKEVKTPTAPESCYGKLYRSGGYILLAGVAQDKNTYLHCVAEMLGLENRMDTIPIPVSVRRPDGQTVQREITIYKSDFTEDISLLFPKYDTAFRYHRCITDGFLGDAPTQLCDAARLFKTVELIFRNSGGKDPLASAEPIPPSWYCRK